MKYLAIAILFLGCWFIWAAGGIYSDSHHMGSKIDLVERQAGWKGGTLKKEDSESLSWEFGLLISEGKYGFQLLERAMKMLVLSGLTLCMAGTTLLIVSTKRPFNKRPEGAPGKSSPSNPSRGPGAPHP
jgi:hypothetical protein